MGGDRHSIIEAGTHMRMAVLTMEEVMRTAGRSELHRSGRLQIESDIRTLEEGCAGMKKLILMAAAALRDDCRRLSRTRPGSGRLRLSLSSIRSSRLCGPAQRMS